MLALEWYGWLTLPELIIGAVGLIGFRPSITA